MPVLRPVERTQVAADDEGVGITFFQPQLAGIPFAFVGIEDITGLPHAIGLGHVDQQDHTGQGLAFTFPGAILANGAGWLLQQFVDLSVQFPPRFEEVNMAAGLATVVIHRFPGAQDGLRPEQLTAEQHGGHA